MQERLRNLEAEMNSEPNPARRTQLEAEVKAMRQYFDALNTDEQQMQERARQLAAQLLTEQAMLQDLTTQLKDVEQSLEGNSEPNHPMKAQRAR